MQKSRQNYGTVAVRSEYLRQIDFLVEATENVLGGKRYKSRNAFVNEAVALLLCNEHEGLRKEERLEKRVMNAWPEQ